MKQLELVIIRVFIGLLSLGSVVAVHQSIYHSHVRVIALLCISLLIMLIGMHKQAKLDVQSEAIDEVFATNPDLDNELYEYNN